MKQQRSVLLVYQFDGFDRLKHLQFLDGHVMERLMEAASAPGSGVEIPSNW